MKVRVEVTQEDIDKGIPSNCTSCPIALALRRQFPEYHSIEVKTTSAVFYLFRDHYDDVDFVAVGYFPDEARIFIHVFDSIPSRDILVTLKPFEFEMEFQMVERFRRI